MQMKNQDPFSGWKCRWKIENLSAVDCLCQATKKYIEIVLNVIARNAFFAHPENMMISLLANVTNPHLKYCLHESMLTYSIL